MLTWRVDAVGCSRALFRAHENGSIAPHESSKPCCVLFQGAHTHSTKGLDLCR